MIGIIQEITKHGWSVVFPATHESHRAFIVQATKPNNHAVELEHHEFVVTAPWTAESNLDDALGELLTKTRDVDARR